MSDKGRDDVNAERTIVGFLGAVERASTLPWCVEAGNPIDALCVAWEQCESFELLYMLAEKIADVDRHVGLRCRTYKNDVDPGLAREVKKRLDKGEGLDEILSDGNAWIHAYPCAKCLKNIRDAVPDFRSTVCEFVARGFEKS